MTVQRFLLEFNIPMAPGDTLMVTAVIRDLKLLYGDGIQLDVKSQFGNIWRHNPYCTPLRRQDPGVRPLVISYKEQMKASQLGRRLHFVTAFHEVFTQMTRMPVPCRLPKGDLHLTDEEKQNPYIKGRYWLIVPGGKADMTIKYWPQDRYQAVVDMLRPWGLRFVQEGAVKPMHEHPPLNNVLNCVGLTSMRDLIVNMYHAEGVICGVSFPMHLAAALDKPCVVIAGGREEPWWEEYSNCYNAFGPECPPVKVPHEYLHTLGQYACCKVHGCWKRRVVPRDDGNTAYDVDPCVRPIRLPYPVAECMNSIQPAHVVEAVMRYYERGQLPPPTSPLMEPIKDPTHAYDQPPTGKPPAICPHCSTSLNHFLIRSGEAPVVVPPEPQMIRPTEMLQEGSNKAPPPPNIPAKPLPPAIKSTVHPAAQRLSVLDHEKVGGKITICVLLHGQEVHYHRNCLNTILASVPPSRMDLRIACNQIGAETHSFLRSIPYTKLYTDVGERRKYPAMREMFWDPECPITTPWLCWFDDDTHVRPEATNWLSTLAESIIACKDPNLGMLGIVKYHPLQLNLGPDPLNWFRTAPWHKGRPFRTAQGNPAPNGSTIHFTVGWFWCLKTEAMRACDIPDRRLNHNGGDCTIGEQLYQGGYSMRAFNTDKMYIFTPPNGRRGYREHFPWYSR
jgi:ADP-heptose:LPS heptosyltransferase